MGWSSANRIFDPVASVLINCGASDEMKTRVLATLIEALQDGDWDTEEESLDLFKRDPAIVAAFRQNNVIIECDAGSGSDDGNLDCVLEAGHEGDHRDFFGTNWHSGEAS